MIGPRVLLIEDRKTLADIVEEVLIEAGCNVVVAGSCAAARDATRGEQYDVILSDHELGDGHGTDLLDEIGHRGRHTILWSGLDRSRDAAKMARPPDAVRLKNDINGIVEQVLEFAAAA